jgi:hypothetical protein
MQPSLLDHSSDRSFITSGIAAQAGPNGFSRCEIMADKRTVGRPNYILIGIKELIE